MNRNEQIYEAAKKFYEALQALGVIRPTVTYSYCFKEDEDSDDLIETGYHGRSNDVLAVCERVKYNILRDAYADQKETL